jgi:ribosomal peptide maturation radical SAM protein 1
MAIDVCFVLTPFLPTHQPALGVSSLVGVLRREGITAKAHYLNIEYLKYLDADVCSFIAKFSQISLLGEILFARALWGDAAIPFADYIAQLRNNLAEKRSTIVSTGDWNVAGAILDKMEPQLERLYHENEQLIEGWAAELVRLSPAVLGFSSTFQQNVSSLAVAKAVRKLDPRGTINIVFGGANCEGEMGAAIADNFSFVDHVVSGEAEQVIVPLVRSAMSGRRSENAPGLPILMPLGRVIHGPPVTNLDSLPVPEFGDYFAASPAARNTNIVAESSRGCWWGAKAHCKFCGLNGSYMAFRRKSAGRFADELRTLSDRYGMKRFLMTDNILEMGYLQSLFPMIESEGFELFYEIKANLRRDHVKAMAAGGVKWVQPGIESLDSRTLKLIDKGCNRLQNLQLIKWCRELDIRPLWSILYGFPGESVAGFAEVADLIPALVHLPPPMQAAPFQMHRFSPYYFDSATYGFTDVRPNWAYQFAYPALEQAEVAKLAYMFEFEHGDVCTQHPQLNRLLEAVDDWIQRYRLGARLTLIQTQTGNYIFDSRNDLRGGLQAITDSETELLKSLTEAKPASFLETRFRPGAKQIAGLLDNFVARKWVIEENGKYLSLVLDFSGADLHENIAQRPAPSYRQPDLRGENRL